jgi:hypothetical protein
LTGFLRELFPEAADAGAEALVREVLETGKPWMVESYLVPVQGKPDATWQGQVVRLPFEPKIFMPFNVYRQLENIKAMG